MNGPFHVSFLFSLTFILHNAMYVRILVNQETSKFIVTQSRQSSIKKLNDFVPSSRFCRQKRRKSMNQKWNFRRKSTIIESTWYVIHVSQVIKCVLSLQFCKGSLLWPSCSTWFSILEPVFVWFGNYSPPVYTLYLSTFLPTYLPTCALSNQPTELPTPLTVPADVQCNWLSNYLLASLPPCNYLPTFWPANSTSHVCLCAYPHSLSPLKLIL